MRVWSIFPADNKTAYGPHVSVPGAGDVTPSQRVSPCCLPSGVAKQALPKGACVLIAKTVTSTKINRYQAWKDRRVYQDN